MKKEKKEGILLSTLCGIAIIGTFSAIIDATISPSILNLLSLIAVPAALLAGYLAGKE